LLGFFGITAHPSSWLEPIEAYRICYVIGSSSRGTWLDPPSAGVKGLRTVIDTGIVQETEGICGGYPRVGNSRIPVRSLVIAYRQLNDFDLVVDTFPTLTRDEIRSALDWYILHPERVEEDIRRNDELLAELSRQR
jgi:uncharacterized protein (DUF433 family)